MHYQFPSDINQRLEACLVNGVYQNADDVLRDALDALADREQEKLRRWNEGNALAIEQSRQGLSRPLDDEAVIERLRKRLALEGIAD